MSTYPFVEISPPTIASPVVTNVSQATRLCGSSASMASRTASEIWSAILSGWPSVTDSEVKVQLVTCAPVVSGSDLAGGSGGDDRVEHGAGNGPLVGKRPIMLHPGR